MTDFFFSPGNWNLSNNTSYIKYNLNTKSFPFFFSLIVDPIKTDVFETLYSKRPSKSSRSSKSSSDSYFANYKEYHEDSSNRHNVQQPQYDSSTYRKSNKKSFNDQTLTKSPTKVYDYQVKNDYIYGDCSDRNQSPHRSYTNDYDHHNDRYKTITLTSARRSFKNNYLNHTNTDKSHQPSWFVDVVPSDNEQFTTRRKYSINSNDHSESQPTKPFKSSLRRKETFKVEKEPSSSDIEQQSNRIALNRKHTFRIDDRETSPLSKPITYSPDKSSISRRSRRTLEPIRVELQSSISERTGKTIPVGVTAPYCRTQNDAIDHSSAITSNQYHQSQPVTNSNQYHQSQPSKVSMKVSSYNALNEIRENLAQLGRRQKYQSPSRDRSNISIAPATQTNYYGRLISIRPTNKSQSNSDHDSQKYITRCNVNYSSGKGRDVNIVEPRGRSIAIGPRLRTAERSVSRDRRSYNSSPIRQYDVKAVTTGPCLSYNPMKERPFNKILKPVTKPTDWTYNQVYL